MLPEPSDINIEAALTAAEPLPVLFSHSCRTERAHALHGELEPHFAKAELRLLLAPFDLGEDVQVAMQRMPLHSVIFHVTAESIMSEAVRAEIKTAQRLRAPVMVLTDDASVPAELRNRIFCSIPELEGQSRAGTFEGLATQMQMRARVHALVSVRLTRS